MPYIGMCPCMYVRVLYLHMHVYLFPSMAQSSLTPAMIAASNGHKEVVEVLIDQCGCSPNEVAEVRTHNTAILPTLG